MILFTTIPSILYSRLTYNHITSPNIYIYIYIFSSSIIDCGDAFDLCIDCMRSWCVFNSKCMQNVSIINQ